MARIAFCIFGLVMVLSGAPQEADSAGLVDRPGDFYTPPDIALIIEGVRQALADRADSAFSLAEVQALLDGIQDTLQAELAPLIRRVEALEGREKGFSQQYYRSGWSRDDLLGKAISREEASQVPHFHAIYDPQGHLLRVRYAEPRAWRTRQKALAGGLYRASSVTPPLVRYFRAFDLRLLDGADYIRRKKIPEEQAYARLLYDDDDLILSAEIYDGDGKLTYSLDYDRRLPHPRGYIQLAFNPDSMAHSLMDLHPFLFLPDWSVVEPGWSVALTMDNEDRLASVQVFNAFGQLSYFYTFSHDLDREKRTETVRATALSDSSTIRQVFAITYDKKRRMTARRFFTPEGELERITTFRHVSRSKDMLAVTKKPSGGVLERKILPQWP